MNKFFRYTTIQGDRWDTIASKFNRSPYDYVDIIKANPSLQGLFILPTGITVRVPVKTEIERRILTPWER